MCGRTKLETTPADLAAYFGITDFELPEWTPRLDIPPSTPLPIVRSVGGAIKLELLRWGPPPEAVKAGKIGRKAFNSAIEFLRPRGRFYKALEEHRCLVVADGFFEWPVVNGKKQRQFISLPSHEPMVFAGVYEQWVPPDGTPGEWWSSIVTVPPRGSMIGIHDRMPVVLPRSAFDLWLDAERLPTADVRRTLDEVSVDEFLVEPWGAPPPAAPKARTPKPRKQLVLLD